MKFYFIFSKKGEKSTCSAIYSLENGKLFSYSVEEDYIVKSDDAHIKTVEKLLEKYKDAKTKVLIEKEYEQPLNALLYLGASIEDFQNQIPARKRLPQIITPYDMDFEDAENSYPDIKTSPRKSGVDDYERDEPAESYDAEDLDDEAFYSESFEEDENFDDLNENFLNDDEDDDLLI